MQLSAFKNAAYFQKLFGKMNLEDLPDRKSNSSL